MASVNSKVKAVSPAQMVISRIYYSAHTSPVRIEIFIPLDIPTLSPIAATATTIGITVLYRPLIANFILHNFAARAQVNLYKVLYRNPPDMSS